jgi:hypothetical protein
LHARLEEFMADAYVDSVLLAVKETGLEESAWREKNEALFSV